MSNRRSRHGAAALLAGGACAVILAAGPAQMRADPAHAKRDTALQDVGGSTVPVIVSTAAGETARIAGDLEQRGRAHLKTLAVIDAVSADLTADDLDRLESDPGVTHLSFDAPVAFASAGGSNSQTSPRTLLETLGLPAAGLDGAGVGVAIIDSGVEKSGDLSHVAAYDVTGASNGGSDDDFGHGTHVAGLVASTGTQSQGLYRGVAPGVHLVSLKVLDAQGQGSTSDVIAALAFATENRQALGIDVINLSLGHPIFEPAETDPLVQAVEAAVRAGIVVVVSAGNTGRNPSTGAPGYAGILSPGNAPSAITVGALDDRGTAARGDDGVADYSSRGPTWYDAAAKPDLIAPGQSLVSDAAAGSTLFLELPDRHVNGNGNVARYLRLSGTSMSAAVTTGVVALMIQAARDAYGVAPAPDAIKAMLEYTALPLAGAEPLAQGHGALNASGAIALTRAAGAGATPSALAAASIAPQTTITGQTWTWAQAFGWSDSVVWGNTGDSAAPAWAQSVVWGNFGWGDSVVWGNARSVVWGNLFGWGDSVVWGNGHDVP